MSKHELPPQERELLTGKIAELLQRIQYQEDPQEMDLLRKIYKKHVPIFRRSYFVALLIRELAHSQGIRFSSEPSTRKRKEKKETPPKPDRKKRPKKEAKRENIRTDVKGEAASTIPGADEDPNTIFISIGKNRRVFPRDLIGLFSSIEKVDPEKIGDIRILDNYSFVTVEQEAAADIITALHGSEYRGRRLTVNFARKKN